MFYTDNHFSGREQVGMDWHLLGNGVAALECAIVLAWLCKIGVMGLRKLPVPVLVACLSLAVGTGIVAQKTNGVNSLPPMPMPPRSVPFVETVTEDDVARGWRVESVTTNETVSYTMPSDAVYVGNWHVHGARSSFGNNIVDFGSAGTPRPTGWTFPLGTNSAAFSSFWYFVDGRIRPTPKDAAHEICAVGVPMSAVPGKSRLWAIADDDSRVLTWENFFLGGDTNSPVNAQIRLFSNGDFTTRSNNVETVCRRVDPDDWDGDGLANEKDANPVAYDGEFFGVPNALQTNANLDAYYTLDVAAVGALDFATIRVTCDGPSDLGDHVVIARTNQVCRVPLLAGATYAVESDLPLSYSAVTSEHAHIVTNSATKLTVSLPLEFSVERIQMRDGGGALNYGVRSSPVDVYPEVSAVTGGCCTVTGGEACFSWSCSEDCRCSGGDHSLLVSATWGGYRLAFAATAGCPCSHVAEQDENGASVRVSFTNEVVVFENAYTNAPGDVVSRRSTSTMLSCRADGGRFGGTVAVALSDGGRLLRTQGTDLPGSAPVPAGGAVLLSAEYEALSESASEGDIVATAVFTENMTGRQLTNETTLTAVRVVSPVSLEPRAWCAPTGAVWLAETGSCPGPGDVAVGLLTELYLLPDYVSFGKLFLQEGSCPATNITGFFAPYANSIQPHGLGVGAWNEVGVSETNNYAGTDFASANFGTIPIALGPGGFEYAITNYWYVKNNGVVDGRLHAFYVSPMKFCISENGNLSVEKYGLIATRNTNDVTTITRRP